MPIQKILFPRSIKLTFLDLRRAILTMIAVIDLDNLLFDPLIEDIASFFYLSAECRLPKIKEGVKKAMEIIKS